jgi:hypothetical protein
LKSRIFITAGRLEKPDFHNRRSTTGGKRTLILLPERQDKYPAFQAEDGGGDNYRKLRFAYLRL